MSVLPKVLIGTPVCDLYPFCWDEFYAAVKNIDYPNFDILFVDNSKTDSWYTEMRKKGVPVIRGEYFEGKRERLVHSRNILRDKALSGGYDYFLNLEQDVIAPKDFLRKLVSHRKRVITGLYYSKFNIHGKSQILPVLYKHDKQPGMMTFFSLQEVENGNLVHARSCGMGCLMIHRDVLQRIEFWMDKEKPGFDDVCFCNSLNDFQIGLFCDTSAICKHMISGRDKDSKKK
jgi:GT2 family glycosyltransferase